MRVSSVVGAIVGCVVVVALAAPAATASADHHSHQATRLAKTSSTFPGDVSTPPHSHDAYVIANHGTTSTVTAYLSRRHDGHWSTLPGTIKEVTKESKGVDVGVEVGHLAALSPHSIWLTGQGRHGHAVILHYTGKSFHRVKLPPLSVNSTTLTGISARSKNDIWAIGDTEVPRTKFSGGVLLHYNGHRWSRVSSPLFGNVDFRSVASSPHNVWILGDATTGGVKSHVIIRVDGTHIARHETPPDLGDATLTAIAAGSHQRAWVVGYRNTGTEDSPDDHPVSAFWSGAGFLVTNLDPPNNRSVALLDVTAVSGSRAVTVGSSTKCATSCTARTLSETPIAYRWNGSWHRASTPHSGRYSSFASFTSVAPLPGGHAIAVGNAQGAKGVVSVTGLYNGHSFTKASGTVPPLRHD
jgi:hypothetical protein